MSSAKNRKITKKRNNTAYPLILIILIKQILNESHSRTVISAMKIGEKLIFYLGFELIYRLMFISVKFRCET